MKRECLVANLFKPDIAQLYDIDPEQNLINTIRVLCTKYPESFRFFVPEELFPDIRNGAIIPVSAEIFDCVPGNHFPIDPLKVLSEQIREYEKKYDRILDKMEIRLYVEGYELPSPKMAMVTLSKTVPAIEKNELMVSGSKDLAVNDVDAQPEVTTDMNLQTYKNQSRSEQFETGRGSEEGYANLQSGSNNTCSSEPSRPMKDGDDQHRDASGKTQTASGEPSGSKSRGEPSGKKLPVGAFVIAGILLAAIIAAVLFFTRDTSVRRFEQAMTDADYQTAVTIYNEEILGHQSKEKKADNKIDEVIDTIMDSYISDANDFEGAIDELKVLSKIQKTEISEKALNTIDEIGIQENSAIKYAEGLDYLEKQDYLNALKSFTAVNEKSNHHEDAQKNLELCVDELIGSVQDPQGEEEFNEGLKSIDDALVLLPDEADLIACKAELQEKYDMFVKNTALQNADVLMKKGEYSDALKVIDDALKVFKDAPDLVEKRNSIAETIRKEYLDRADGFIGSNEYTKAFQEITEALDILKDDELLTAKNEEYRKSFVEYITTQVNAKVTDEKYDEALQLLTSAQEIFACAEFDTLTTDIEAKKAAALDAMTEYTAPNVEFVKYDGSISGKEDFDEYTITAIREGLYRFDVSDMMSGFKVNIYVYGPDGTEIAHSSYGLAINEGITATLEKDKTYIVKVTHYSNDGHYILSIGQQKETIDITNREIVHDSIEYADQENRYDITTTYGGKYRFDLANVYSGCKANITVFDDHNYKIANTNYGIENNQGLSADLEAGRTYRVTVTQYSGASTYDLKIGKQSATQTISSGESITGNVTFKDQQNRYDYVANSSGEYIFSLSGMRSGVECNISVFDDHDYKIGYSSYGLKSDGSITATLEKGKKYRIVVYQYAKFGEYTLSILAKS